MNNVSFREGNVYRWSLGATIPLLVAVYITYCTSNDFELYNLFIEVFCASICTALFVVCILSKRVEYNYYYYIGVGFFFVSMLSFIQSIFIKAFGYSLPESFTGIISVSTFYYAYLVVILSFYLLRRGCRLVDAMIYHLMLLSTIIIIFSCINFNSSLESRSSGIIHFLLIVMLAIISMIIIWMNKGWLSEDEMIYNYCYIGCILFHHITSFLNYYGIYDLYFEAGIAKYVAYYFIFMAMSKFVLSKSILIIKNDLEEVERQEGELNKIISKRNKLLHEGKIQIEKGEKSYSNLIDAISDGVLIFNNDKLKYLNKSSAKILGVTNKKSKIGSDIKDILSKLLEDYKGGFFYVTHLPEKFKIENVNKGQDEYDLFSSMLDDNLRLIYIKNITEINRNREIRKKYEDYLKEESLKNEFYSNISHELRTPINLIYSALQLNEINIEDKAFEPIAARNKVIKQNCLRLNRTISNFIDTNRLSEGFFKTDMKIHNIVPIIENVALECVDYFNKINSTIVFDASEEEIYVECDKGLMERITLNLLSNSLKYGTEGMEVLITIKDIEDVVIISVDNDGYTIDQNMQPYIFDKFTKVNKSLHRAKEGSGLGLFLVKELLEIQGGKISLEVGERGGTEFIIRLPRSYEAEIAVDSLSSLDIKEIKEKVDTEFSDIYL